MNGTAGRVGSKKPHKLTGRVRSRLSLVGSGRVGSGLAIQNAAASLVITGARKYDHMTPILRVSIGCQTDSESPLKRHLQYTSIFTAWRRPTSQSTERWHPTLAADIYNLPTCANPSSHGRRQVRVTAARSVDQLCVTTCHVICGLQTSRWTRSRINWKPFCLTLTCSANLRYTVSLRKNTSPFLPRCMECRRGVARRIRFDRLSVRLSVKRVDCDKTEERSVQIFILYKKSFSLVSEKKNGWWGRPLLGEILGQSAPVGANRRFWTDIRS